MDGRGGGGGKGTRGEGEDVMGLGRRVEGELCEREPYLHLLVS